MPAPDWPTVPPHMTDQQQALRLLLLTTRNHNLGKFNCYADVALDVSPATTTTVIDPRIHPDCVLLFDPLDAAAASELAAGSMYVLSSNRTEGQAIITHSANASARTFRMIVLS